jgi:manganese-dependent inorganic pyrophosphatase
MDKVMIFGHKNPDTDSVCGAIALSYLKNKLGNNTEPRILGSLSKETEFVLKKFKVDTPLYLNDVKVQLKDVNYHKHYIINENRTIYEAFNIMNKYTITGLPLVDDENKFTGYVSLKEIASEMIYNENLKVSTTFDNIVSTLEATKYIKFDDYIEGYAHAATFDDSTFIKDIIMDEESILIVGDRESIIRHAIERHVKLIIMVKNKDLSRELKALAKKNKVNIIITSKSSFKIARVLCLSNPIKSIRRNQSTVTFNELDYLTDFNEITSKLKHTNYPIVNNNNVCLGMLRTIDAHEVKRKKVILVDHNMVGQSVDGLYESDILEIIDHHNIGDINTSIPINFRNMSVGSVSTIIYYLFEENEVKMPKYIAGLLLSGIISDTLLLQSPTTTDIDRLVAKKLAKVADLDIKKYGLELLSSGVSIEGLTPNEIIHKDFKTFKVGDDSMAIGQVFTTSFSIYKDIMDDLIKEVDHICEDHDYKVCALFITDFLTNDSRIIYSEKSKKIVEMAFGIENIEEGHLLRGVVSRKKQIVPNLMSTLEHI